MSVDFLTLPFNDTDAGRGPPPEPAARGAVGTAKGDGPQREPELFHVSSVRVSIYFAASCFYASHPGVVIFPHWTEHRDADQLLGRIGPGQPSYLVHPSIQLPAAARLENLLHLGPFINRWAVLGWDRGPLRRRKHHIPAAACLFSRAQQPRHPHPHPHLDLDLDLHRRRPAHSLTRLATETSPLRTSTVVPELGQFAWS